MLLYLAVAPPTLLAARADQGSNVFTAKVEAVAPSQAGTVGTRFGLRITEEFVGHVVSGYVVVETGNGFTEDCQSYLSGPGVDLAFGEELLLFGSLDDEGRLTVEPSSCMSVHPRPNLMLSKRPSEDGTLAATRVGDYGFSRERIGAACAVTGAVESIEGDGDPWSGPTAATGPACVWDALLAWLRARPSRPAGATVPGDVPLSPGNSGCSAAPQKN